MFDPDFVESANEEVLAWRITQLERAGFPDNLAIGLAACPHVDLHQAADLLARGCEAELAVEILV